MCICCVRAHLGPVSLSTSVNSNTSVTCIKFDYANVNTNWMCFEVVNWAESRVRNLFSLCSSFLGAGNDTLSDSTVDEKKRLESLDELYEIRLRKRKVEFNVCWSFEMGQNIELEISSNSLSLLFKLLPKILKFETQPKDKPFSSSFFWGHTHHIYNMREGHNVLYRNSYNTWWLIQLQTIDLYIL